MCILVSKQAVHQLKCRISVESSTVRGIKDPKHVVKSRFEAVAMAEGMHRQCRNRPQKPASCQVRASESGRVISKKFKFKLYIAEIFQMILTAVKKGFKVIVRTRYGELVTPQSSSLIQ